MRFYAGSPIRTSKGLNIGTLCLLDDRPRILSEEEKEILVMMADVVMSHLETIRRERKRSVGVRMQNNLGKFVAGGAIARPPPGWLEVNHKKDGKEDRRHDRPPPFIITNHTKKSCGPACAEPPLISPTSQDPDPFSNRVDKPFSADSNSTVLPSNSQVNSSESIQTIDSLFPSRGSPDCTYARASILIREAMAVDDVFFVKPPVGPATRLQENVVEYFGQGSSVVPTPARSPLWSGEESRLTPGIGQTPSTYSVFDEDLLRKILKIYPSGCIFNHIASSARMSYASHAEGDESLAPQDELPWIEERAIASLLNLAPTSKASIFFPLYDTVGKVSAMGFVITKNPARVFNGAELSYLGIFGNAIMAEVKLLNMISG
jgi:hypothetical protein